MSDEIADVCEYIHSQAPVSSAYIANQIRQALTTLRLQLDDLPRENADSLDREADVKSALDRLDRLANALAGQK